MNSTLLVRFFKSFSQEWNSKGTKDKEYDKEMIFLSKFKSRPKKIFCITVLRKFDLDVMVHFHQHVYAKLLRRQFSKIQNDSQVINVFLHFWDL
jgi:hypothetical protein